MGFHPSLLPPQFIHFLSYHCHRPLESPGPGGSYLLELHIITQPCPLSLPFTCGLQPRLGAQHHYIPYKCPWAAASAVTQSHCYPLFRTLSPLPAGLVSASNLTLPSRKHSGHQKGTLLPALQENLLPVSVSSLSAQGAPPSVCYRLSLIQFL